MSVRLHEMSWPEVRQLLTKPHAVILPLGSIEEHGAHLPLNVDSANAAYICERAARRVSDEHDLRVIVAPTIDYTESRKNKFFDASFVFSAGKELLQAEPL